MSQHQGVTEDWKLSVIRNGYLPKREILTGIGPVSVRIPKVRTIDGVAPYFSFRIGSALCPKNEILGGGITLAVPQRCIFRINGRRLKSTGRAWCSVSLYQYSFTTKEWIRANEYQHWREKPLDEDRWVYTWVDGVYSGLRSEKDKLCALVIIGVNDRGQKQFLAFEDGVRESTQSWREVLLKL